MGDLPPLSFRPGNGLPLYARESTGQNIEQVFKYAFDSESTYATRPRVRIERLGPEFELFGARFITVPLVHGDHEVVGFRFGQAAYLTDFSGIPESSMEMLHGPPILFLDALRRTPPAQATVARGLTRLRDSVRQRRRRECNPRPYPVERRRCIARSFI